MSFIAFVSSVYTLCSYEGIFDCWNPLIIINVEGDIAISENGGNNQLWLYDHD